MRAPPDVTGGPDPALLARANLMVLPRRFAEREARLWLVDAGGERAVLRRLDPSLYPPEETTLADRDWLHAFLDRLASTGFPAPRPVPAFEGRGCVLHAEAVWELLTYLDGEEIAWRPDPPLEEMGALLARLHDATAGLDLPGQRPTALPLAAVPTVLQGPHPPTGGREAEKLKAFGRELGDLLAAAGHGARAITVVHGDFTAHNVLTTGRPPRPAGVIDFGLAHIEAAVADIGFGLWRTGRPYQGASVIDHGRARDFVRGYAGVRAITRDDALAVPVYILGRGLQMLAKRVRAGTVPEAPPLLDWLRANVDRLGESLARVVAESRR